jgi:hypothetical protein
LSPQGGNSRQEALDLLALFLHHSPKKFEVPGPLRKEVFLRLARLQRQAGAWERRHRVRVARAAALAGVVALFGIDMLWGDFLSMLVGTGAIFGVLSFLAFVLAGQMLAFIFAEVMTSLEWILQRSAAIVKILALGAAGIAAGAPLLWVMAGTGRTWYAGGLLGLALGLQNAYPALKAPTLNWVTSVVSGLAVVGIASLALQPMEAASLGSVLTTAGFVLFYLLARPGRASQQE